jgi:hypothetical protein
LNPVFFTDRDLGKQFPAILAEAGLTVESHGSHFEPSAADEEWLAEIGKRGWVAITHDKNIRYKHNELAAVKIHRVALLVVIGAAPFPELARSFVATASRIEAFLRGQRPPLIAKVYRASAADLSRDPMAPGRVEKWFPQV